MDQIFRDHALFMAAGLLLGIFLTWVPHQTKWAKVLSRAILAFSVLYPALIVLLYVCRDDLGESYAYHIHGLLAGILLGIDAGILCIIWLVVYLLGGSRGKRARCRRNQVELPRE